MNKQQQIEKYITELIDQRMLKAGDRIFSLREMAAMHHTSITPVIAAYEHLEMLGVLQSRPKSGFFVTRQDQSGEMELPPFFKLFNLEDDRQASTLYRAYGLSNDRTVRYPFALRRMPPHLCDSSHIISCYRQSMLQYPDEGWSSESNIPIRMLGEAIIQCADRTKWLTDPNQICITIGLVQALTLAMEASITRDSAVAIECPGNSYFFFAARLFGARPVPVVSHADTGLDIDLFEEAVEKDPSIRCLMCMPNFSTPTGSLMPLPNKQRLRAFCERKNIAIIEYDIAGDQGFGSPRPLPVKAGGADQVIYISGFDHVTDLHYISGGKYQNSIRGFATLHQVHVPLVQQEGLAMYLMRPQSRKFLHHVRSSLQKALGAVRGTVEECFPENTRITAPRGGRFIWIELPGNYDSLALLDRALRHDISFSPGSVFSAGPEFANCMRLNCAVAAQRPEMLEGIRLLASLL